MDSKMTLQEFDNDLRTNSLIGNDPAYAPKNDPKRDDGKWVLLNLCKIYGLGKIYSGSNKTSLINRLVDAEREQRIFTKPTKHDPKEGEDFDTDIKIKKKKKKPDFEPYTIHIDVNSKQSHKDLTDALSYLELAPVPKRLHWIFEKLRKLAEE